MKTLSRYLNRAVIGSTLLIFSALLFLFSFFDLIHELRDLGKGGYHLLQIFVYVALNLPGHVYELFPVAALIGTLSALTQLAAHSELTVMRVSGMPIGTIGRSLMRVGTIFVIVNFIFGEVISPYSDRLAVKLQLEATKSVVATQFRSGLWAKQDKTFINIQEMLPDTSLINLRIYEFDPTYRLKSISLAKRGEYVGNNAWRLSDVEQTLFNGNHVEVRRLNRTDWHSALSPDILGVLLVSPEQMSLWNLTTYIDHLRENNQKTIRYEIAQWQKLTYPFTIPVMILLAVPFSFYQRRSAGAGARIFLGIMLGLVFHLANRLLSELGVLNDWNPILCTLTPGLLFLLAAIAMIRWVEEGKSLTLRLLPRM
jgi:lipopolysaccharide export system permease protein